MPAALVMRVVVAVAASILWASTGRAGEQIVEGVTAILLPGLLALARFLLELAVIALVGWLAVVGVRRVRRVGDRDSR
jgi:hypothetical protein